MTQDEQEASSFRYIAPRVFRLSSGNIAVIPMMGDKPISIYTVEQFNAFCLPNQDELEQEYNEIRQLERRGKKLTSLNLADLGL